MQPWVILVARLVHSREDLESTVYRERVTARLLVLDLIEVPADRAAGVLIGEQDLAAVLTGGEALKYSTIPRIA